MDDHENMRAADADRQETVERLRTALDDGRLKLEEYLERMGHAYEAVTYGDLVPLTSDLPKTHAVAKPRQPAPPAPAQAASAPARPAEVDRSGWFAGLPKALKVAWTAWTIAVSVNVVVWVLVCATTAQLIYPWPLWVAGPWGAVLLAISATASASRRGPAASAASAAARPELRARRLLTRGLDLEGTLVSHDPGPKRVIYARFGLGS